MSAMAGSTSSAGSQKTPCTGPSFSQPAEAARDVVGGRRAVEGEDGDAPLLEDAREGLGDAALVGRDDDARALAERHAGRLAPVERGPQRRHRHAPRHLVGVLDRRHGRVSRGARLPTGTGLPAGSFGPLARGTDRGASGPATESLG